MGSRALGKKTTSVIRGQNKTKKKQRKTRICELIRLLGRVEGVLSDNF